jgi:hypothetical protein
MIAYTPPRRRSTTAATRRIGASLKAMKTRVRWWSSASPGSNPLESRWNLTR